MRVGSRMWETRVFNLLHSLFRFTPEAIRLSELRSPLIKIFCIIGGFGEAKAIVKVIPKRNGSIMWSVNNAQKKSIIM